jgi:hypothetical protein
MGEAVKNVKNNMHVLYVHSMDLCESVMLSEERVLPAVASSLFGGQNDPWKKYIVLAKCLF